MLAKIVSIYDEVAGVFGMPLFFHNSEAAVRYFSFLCQGDDSDVGRFPHHHHLYDIGEFDTDSGTIFGAEEQPKLLISGLSVKKESNNG